MLVGEHALMVDLRARIMLTQVRMGELSDARAALDGIAEQDRDPAEVRVPAAAIHLDEGSPEGAIELLAPVTERSVESLIPTWAAIHALLFDCAAREQLGDTRTAEASLERALDLAEPEGLILPFTIIPRRRRGRQRRFTRSSPAPTATTRRRRAGTSQPASALPTCSTWPGTSSPLPKAR
jgi:LuxR family transcriptional regulator, maltose regulon positive regulatory protein